MRHIIIAPALLATLAASATPVVGAPPAFVSRSAFEHAAGTMVSEGFQHCARATTVFTGPLSAAGTSACAPGAVRSGLTIGSTGGAGDRSLFLAAPYFAANHEYAVGQDGPVTDALTIGFTGTRSVGFDIFQDFGGGQQLGRTAAYDVRVFSGALLLGDYNVSVRSGRSGFFGVISKGAPITSITVDNPLAYDLVGNIAFAPATLPARPATFARIAAAIPTPEPAGIMLFGLAIGGVAVARRR